MIYYLFIVDWFKVEDVYAELVYSLMHAICRSERTASTIEDVFVYLQKAFQISKEQHEQFLSTAQQRKVTQKIQIMWSKKN